MPSEDPQVKARILIVDDHPIVRQGMAQLVNLQSDLLLCCEAGASEEALLALQRCRHDLAIIDLSLQGVSGFNLISTIIAQDPQLPILVMSMHEETLYAERALRLGARGYIMKHQATANIYTAIRRILAGGIYLSDDLQRQIIERLYSSDSIPECVDPVASLSNREIEVLRLIGHGFGTREIAAKLDRSIKTIDAHRANLKEKLGLKTGMALICFAVRWIETDIAAG